MTLQEFVNKNRKKIINMKVRCTENQFVYLDREGDLRYGRTDLYGHNDQASFGGECANESLASQDLDYIMALGASFGEHKKEINA